MQLQLPRTRYVFSYWCDALPRDSFCWTTYCLDLLEYIDSNLLQSGHSGSWKYSLRLYMHIIWTLNMCHSIYGQGYLWDVSCWIDQFTLIVRWLRNCKSIMPYLVLNNCINLFFFKSICMLMQFSHDCRCICSHSIRGIKSLISGLTCSFVAHWNKVFIHPG